MFERQMVLEFNMDNSVKCRTCMGCCGERFRRITSSVGHFETICKDIIILLIPQMVGRLNDDTDVICFHCYKALISCVKFIQKCLEVEVDLKSKDENKKDTVRIADNSDTEIINQQLNRAEYTDINEAVASDDRANTLDSKNVVGKPMEFDEVSELTADVLLHNRIISVKQPNTDVMDNFICTMASNGIRILHCSLKPEESALKKRILFLGMDSFTESLKCKECGLNSRTPKAAERHAVSHKRRKERKELRRKMCLQKKEERRLAEIAAQLEEDERRRNGFKCKRCHEYYQSKEELNAHLQTHTPYTCDQCGKGFPLKQSLQAHKHCHNPKNSYICAVCGRGYSQASTLRQHMFTHKKGLFLCTKCPKIFGQELSLRKHMRNLHEKPNPVQCKECGKMIKKASLLSGHYSVRQEFNLDECDIINESFSTITASEGDDYENKSDRDDLHSGDRLMHLKDGKFKCELCGELFVRKDYLKRHVKRHSGMGRRIIRTSTKMRQGKGQLGQFKCKVCNKIFKQVQNLKTHLFVHSSLKRYRCKLCGLSFTTQTSKWRHEKLHEKNADTLYKCPVCWRICENEEDLSQHVSKHPTPYQCDSCELSFARKYLLTHHVSEIHTVAEYESHFYQSILMESLKQSELEEDILME